MTNTRDSVTGALNPDWILTWPWATASLHSSSDKASEHRRDWLATGWALAPWWESETPRARASSELPSHPCIWHSAWQQTGAEGRKGANLLLTVKREAWARLWRSGRRLDSEVGDQGTEDSAVLTGGQGPVQSGMLDNGQQKTSAESDAVLSTLLTYQLFHFKPVLN